MKIPSHRKKFTKCNLFETVFYNKNTTCDEVLELALVSELETTQQKRNKLSIAIPLSSSCTKDIKSLMNMLNSVGDEIHPCLTPLLTLNYLV